MELVVNWRKAILSVAQRWRTNDNGDTTTSSHRRTNVGNPEENRRWTYHWFQSWSTRWVLSGNIALSTCTNSSGSNVYTFPAKEVLVGLRTVHVLDWRINGFSFNVPDESVLSCFSIVAWDATVYIESCNNRDLRFYKYVVNGKSFFVFAAQLPAPISRHVEEQADDMLVK